MNFRRLSSWLARALVLSFGLGFGLHAQADLIYAVYSGSENGVTVRDAETFSQINYFDPGFLVDGIAAGTHDDMYLTSGNSIYHYSNSGSLLGSFAWPSDSITYTSITVGDGQIFATYEGTQTGITVRDATTLVQATSFETTVNNGIGSATADEMYRVADNHITRYDDSGSLILDFAYWDEGLTYTNSDVGTGLVFASYTGSFTGVTVRDAVTLAQSNYFDPGFAINGLAASPGNEVYLTSANSIYRYTAGGDLIGSFSFPDSGIVYGDIAYAYSVPEPGTLGLLGAGLLTLGTFRRRRP